MDWTRIHAGHIKQAEIMEVIKDEEWQKTRVMMKGLSLIDKYFVLTYWLRRNEHSRRSQVQVTNYINALARGGLIKAKK